MKTMNKKKQEAQILIPGKEFLPRGCIFSVNGLHGIGFWSDAKPFFVSVRNHTEKGEEKRKREKEKTVQELASRYGKNKLFVVSENNSEWGLG